ncbi:MAG: hypothetical protein Ct9H300mP1_05490 [Planctomycetaceae bacterium]|nr:MAG: hypothetical protein Ct9H300mP1_05490 [Planctomycetaceae bacterium]
MRHTPLLGTHVDSIFYSTTQSFNFFTHQSKVAEVFRSRDGSFANNNLAKFLEQDTDGLRMSSQFARKHGLETVWTLRKERHSRRLHTAISPQVETERSPPHHVDAGRGTKTQRSPQPLEPGRFRAPGC